MLDNGIEIAVKKLYHTPGLVDEQFKKEFDSLMRVQHPNIIRLVGYCYETREKYIKIETGEYIWAKREERALCFEFLHRGSLDKVLFGMIILDFVILYAIKSFPLFLFLINAHFCLRLQMNHVGSIGIHVTK